MGPTGIFGGQSRVEPMLGRRCRLVRRHAEAKEAKFGRANLNKERFDGVIGMLKIVQSFQDQFRTRQRRQLALVHGWIIAMTSAAPNCRPYPTRAGLVQYCSLCFIR